MFRNNSCLEKEVHKYTALTEIYGSDHRPVMLDMSIKDFMQPAYSDIERILD